MMEKYQKKKKKHNTKNDGEMQKLASWRRAHTHTTCTYIHIYS